MLITDQVATAPCTDCVQARCLTFEKRLMTGVLVRLADSQSYFTRFATRS